MRDDHARRRTQAGPCEANHNFQGKQHALDRAPRKRKKNFTAVGGPSAGPWRRTLQDVVEAGGAGGVGTPRDAVQLLLQRPRTAQQAHLQLGHRHAIAHCTRMHRILPSAWSMQAAQQLQGRDVGQGCFSKK